MRLILLLLPLFLSFPSTVIVCPALCLGNLSLLVYLGLFAAGSSHPYILLLWCVLCSLCLFFCPCLFAWILCFYTYPFGLFGFQDFFYDADLHLPLLHAISNSFLVAKPLSSCSKSFTVTRKLGAAQCCQTSLPVISQKQTIHVVQRG